MNPFIASLLSAATAYAFVHLTGAPAWIKKKLNRRDILEMKIGQPETVTVRRIKPLDCHTCLSFWICFAYITFCEASYSWFEGLAHCFLAMIISQLIYLILKRI